MSCLQRRNSDDGSALLVAIMTVGVCLSLALVGVGVAQSANRSSGVDRQRLVAVNAAEAGVDSAYTAIQAGSLAPPCSLSSANLRSGPDVAGYATSVTYYDAAGAVMSCPVMGVPVKALIRSTATTNTLGGGGSHGVRTMEALVNMTPVNGNSLSNAIYANGSLSFDNKTTITGDTGPDANVYSNADFACANNENFAGSIYSQGNITMQGSCALAGNIWAQTGIAHSSSWNGSVAGFAKAGGGDISLNQGPGTVTGNLYASGSIAYGGCGSSGKCFTNGSPGAPPAQPFPIIRGDAATLATWAAGSATVAPYTVYTDNNCGSIASNIVNMYAKKGSNTLVSTSCLVNLTSDVTLKNDLAIFTSGGLTTGKLTMSSAVAGVRHNVHFIVPYDSVAYLPCSSPVLDTDKGFNMSDDIALFIYSPCAITYRNQSTHVGQIYGGSTVSIQNQFTMQFVPVPVLGVDPASLPTVSYVPSIVYKRETR